MWGRAKYWSVLLGAVAATVLVLASCVEEPRETMERPVFVTTIPPLAAILREVAGERAEVKSLLAPGASPHTYEPKPSDMKSVEKAKGLFFAEEHLDGWALSFDQPNRIEMFKFVPEDMRREMAAGRHHNNRKGKGTPDGHFWTSPLTVKAMLPGLVGELARLDPAGAAAYEANAERFAAELDALHDEVSEMLEPFAGEHLLLVHPSFLYFMADYGLELGGLVEPAPGKEPTPKSMLELIEIAQERDIRAIFTEPQLPEEPVQVLAEETGLPVYTLDPLGGAPARATYEELMHYDAETIAQALGDGFAAEV